LNGFEIARIDQARFAQDAEGPATARMSPADGSFRVSTASGF
jgi:hypothetical protein